MKSYYLLSLYRPVLLILQNCVGIIDK